MSGFGKDTSGLRMTREGTVTPKAVWNGLLDLFDSGMAPVGDDAETIIDGGSGSASPINPTAPRRHHPFQLRAQFQAGGTSSVEVRFYPGYVFAFSGGRWRKIEVTWAGGNLQWFDQPGAPVPPVNSIAKGSSGVTKYWLELTLGSATEETYYIAPVNSAQIIEKAPGVADPEDDDTTAYIPVADLDWDASTNGWGVVQHLRDHVTITPPGFERLEGVTEEFHQLQIVEDSSNTDCLELTIKRFLGTFLAVAPLSPDVIHKVQKCAGKAADDYFDILYGGQLSTTGETPECITINQGAKRLKLHKKFAELIAPDPDDFELEVKKCTADPPGTTYPDYCPNYVNVSGTNTPADGDYFAVGGFGDNITMYLPQLGTPDTWLELIGGTGWVLYHNPGLESETLHEWHGPGSGCCPGLYELVTQPELPTEITVTGSPDPANDGTYTLVGPGSNYQNANFPNTPSGSVNWQGAFWDLQQDWSEGGNPNYSFTWIRVPGGTEAAGPAGTYEHDSPSPVWPPVTVSHEGEIGPATVTEI